MIGTLDLAPKQNGVLAAIGQGVTSEVVKIVGVDTVNDKMEVVRGIIDNHTHAASESVFVLNAATLWKYLAKTLTGINT